MKKYYYRAGFYILVGAVFIGVNYYLYNYHQDFIRSNFLTSLITLIVGGIAIILYLAQKKDSKKDAAKIILQEIRRAEQIIDSYKESGMYQFNKRIIATNSWNKNIHYFVGELDNDELDKISDLYSTGEYLDYVVKRVSDIGLDYMVEEIKKTQVTDATGAPTLINLKDISPAWKTKLEVISKNLELIYHSAVVEKLKKIAK